MCEFISSTMMSDVQQKLSRLTPAQLKLLELRRRQAAAPKSAPDHAATITPRADRETAPLSTGQKKFWLAAKIDPNSLIPNTTRSIRLTGPLDVARLANAFTRVVARHEILRTTYETDPTTADPLQRIHAPAGVPLPLIDLSDLPADARESASQQLAADDARKPIDIRRGPVFRAWLARLAADHHVLTFTVHHIAFDGWSVGLFQRDLFAAYTAEPAPLAVQYADFAAWQHADPNLEISAIDGAYWKVRLADLTTLELPTDRPRSPVQSTRGARKSFHVPAALVDALKSAGRRRQATLFMTLLAGFNALLHRYSGSRDVVVGSQVAGRSRVECEPMIGMFVETIVLRSSFADDPTMGELICRVRDEVLGAMRHGSATYEDLLRIAKPDRDPSRHAMFQVAFQLRNFPREDCGVGPDLKFESFEYDNGIARTDLHVMAAEREGGGVELTFEYCTDLFDGETIRRLAAHYEAILRASVEDADARVSTITLLGADERKAIIEDWNATGRDFALAGGVHKRFAEVAAKTPGAVAARFRDASLTFRELDTRANQLAHALIARGVVPGDRVGLCCARGIDLAVGLLGILKSGAAFVPLDPKYPRERLDKMLRDARPRVIVATEVAGETLAPSDPQVLRIDRVRASLRQLPSHAPAVTVSPDDLAYVMFTSGSTGEPNGVMVTHRGLLNHNLAAIDLYGLTPADRVLQFASIGFDLSLEEMFPTWLAGAAVVFLPPDAPIIGAAFSQFLSREGITVLDLPTAFWHVWAQQLAGDGDEIPKNLRAVIVGGEKVSAAIYRNWLDRTRGRLRFFNSYGPTETTIIATACEPPTSPSADWHDIPIGRPIANTRAYVLDVALQPQPIGVSGELYIAGHGLARGYLDRAELTAQRFIDHAEFGRLYKTGDLCRWRASGEIEFVGRADAQVKVRGFRIEPGEIETALLRRTDVGQAVVIAVGGERGEKDLVAYVTPRERGAALSADAIRMGLSGQLPHYMMPAHVVVLDALPLTANGKVDRKALPKVERGGGGSDSRFVAPETPLQIKLAEIWCEVLGVPRVGLHDNFFDLGGQSLLAIRLFAQIEKQLGRALPISALFTLPTVAQLAPLVSEPARQGESNDSGDSGVVIPLKPNGTSPPLFCLAGIRGHVFSFRKLASLLADDQPVYGLQVEGLETSRQPMDRLEDIAAFLVRHARSLQPHGPYALLGYSFGGVVAFEMARQLFAAGEAVRLVGMLDSFAGPKHPLKPLSQRLVIHGRQFVSGGARSAFSYVAQRWRGILRRLMRVQVHPLSPALPTGENEAVAQAIDRVRTASKAALRRYQPGKYDGAVTLLRASEHAAWFDFVVDRPMNGWEAFAKQVDVHSISGAHLTLLDAPSVTEVADVLQEKLSG